MTFLLALVLSLLMAIPAKGQSVYDHPCDQLQGREAVTSATMPDGAIASRPHGVVYNPLVGVASVLFFCGPKALDPVTYAVTIDGAPVPSPGRLLIAHYEYSELQRPDAGKNDLVPYVGPGPLVSMPTDGPHRVRVVYGANKVAVEFTWVGAVCTCALGPDKVDPVTGKRDPGDPRPVGWFGFGSLVVQCPDVCAARIRKSP